MKKLTLGILGVRGYVGKELLILLRNHPNIKVSWVSSRQLVGNTMDSFCSGVGDFLIESLSPQDVANKKSDIVVLALPNGISQPFVDQLDKSGNNTLIIDLSADYRFDSNWFYSIPELGLTKNPHKNPLYQIKKISNPGCYATAIQLALAPIINKLSATPHCFGVSGYSGAGTTPSPNNDPDTLKDNLIPYKLVEHLHEKEVSFQLNKQVSFSPHVAEFFRGINMTIQFELKEKQTSDSLYQIYKDFYKNAKLVNCQEKIPVIQEVINTPYCLIGGIHLSQDGKRGSIVSCLDNLLKGAASQALQNINLAFDLTETLGIEV